MPYIHHQLNGASVGYYELSNETLTIGRSADNHLVVDDATVSGHHAVIEATAQGFRIRDLNSTNGVWVNVQRVPEAPLRVEDSIRVGTHELQYAEQISDELQRTLKIKKSWIPGIYYTAEK
ncbi:FHA domain-containing protein [Marinimicrobium koreense]|uniref:FHA domain-containing protein n=1 Tax=Marinimicrobium koreense TaxID=306545 RepID=A0A3N1NX23_9GAMM|nr:FHA domain-containing protein [Marinimicrobium koreense]ROQ19848.1 FHA domain-containing protein [Marinimicrobium koreense]